MARYSHNSRAETSPKDGLLEWVLDKYTPVLISTREVANVVAERRGTNLNHSPRRELRTVSTDCGLLERYADLLCTLQDKIEAAEPVTVVPAPPYVTISSTGPILRLPLDTGRLVIYIEVFHINSDTGQYRRSDLTIAKSVSIERH